MSDRAIVEVRVDKDADESTEDIARKVKACLNGNRARNYFRDIDVLRVDETQAYD